MIPLFDIFKTDKNGDCLVALLRKGPRGCQEQCQAIGRADSRGLLCSLPSHTRKANAQG